MWWKNDEDDSSYVQFVATVVISLRQFWVKSVLSPPLPPCSRERSIGAWSREPITPPPAVSHFKQDTFHLFNAGSANSLEDSISRVAAEIPRSKPIPPENLLPPQPSPVFQTPAPPPLQQFQPQPVPTAIPPPPRAQQPFFQQQQPVTQAPAPQFDPFTRRHLSHVIPVQGMETNRRPPPSTSSFNTNFQQQPQQPARFVNTAMGCRDNGTPQQCSAWATSCQSNTRVKQFCAATCRAC